MIAGISVIALIWVNNLNWFDHQPSPFGITPIAPYFVLVAILTSRVHRNTKLGLYNMVSVESIDMKFQPQTAARSTFLRNSHPVSTPTITPIAFSNVDGDSLRSGCSTTRSRGSVNFLDFGMV